MTRRTKVQTIQLEILLTFTLTHPSWWTTKLQVIQNRVLNIHSSWTGVIFDQKKEDKTRIY